MLLLYTRNCINAVPQAESYRCIFADGSHVLLKLVTFKIYRVCRLRLKSCHRAVSSSVKRSNRDEIIHIRHMYYLSVVVVDVGSPRIAAVFLPHTLTGDFHLDVQVLSSSDNLGKYVSLEAHFEILTMTIKSIKFEICFMIPSKTICIACNACVTHFNSAEYCKHCKHLNRCLQCAGEMLVNYKTAEPTSILSCVLPHSFVTSRSIRMKIVSEFSMKISKIRMLFSFADHRVSQNNGTFGTNDLRFVPSLMTTLIVPMEFHACTTEFELLTTRLRPYAAAQCRKAALRHRFRISPEPRLHFLTSLNSQRILAPTIATCPSQIYYTDLKFDRLLQALSCVLAPQNPRNSSRTV